MDAQKAKAEFLVVCGDILAGNASKEDIERVTESMVATGQHDFMRSEFLEIQSKLANK